MARTGRRPGASGTREAILDAARRAFAGQGYQHATIRGVAELAGVDPALVHHYFGTKQELFVAAVQLPVNPVEQLTAVLAQDPEEVLGQIAHRLGSPDARLRATLVGSQIIGLAMARYIVKVEPLASAPAAQVAAAVGPTLQRYLTGEIAAPALGRP
jgi:AcrR family transcriptional regulator